MLKKIIACMPSAKAFGVSLALHALVLVPVAAFADEALVPGTGVVTTPKQGRVTAADAAQARIAAVFGTERFPASVEIATGPADSFATEAIVRWQQRHQPTAVASVTLPVQ